MRKGSETEKSTCPVCQKLVMLRQDGTIRTHLLPVNRLGQRVNCPGSLVRPGRGAGLEKVISGGQPGAGVAGLRAAWKSGLETGGWTTRRARATEGPRRDWALRYGLRPAYTSDDAKPAEMNVFHSDGTVLLFVDPNDPGTALARRYCLSLNRHHYDIDLRDLHWIPGDGWDRIRLRRLGRDLIENGVRVLHVAGAALPDIEGRAELILIELFKEMALLTRGSDSATE